MIEVRRVVGGSKGASRGEIEAKHKAIDCSQRGRKCTGD